MSHPVEDRVIGTDQDGQPVYESQYWANPDAFTAPQDEPVTAAATPSPSDPFDYVIAQDQSGTPIYASEYFGNPAEFGIADSVRNVSSAGQYVAKTFKKKAVGQGGRVGNMSTGDVFRNAGNIARGNYGRRQAKPK